VFFGFEIFVVAVVFLLGLFGWPQRFFVAISFFTWTVFVVSEIFVVE